MTNLGVINQYYRIPAYKREMPDEKKATMLMAKVIYAISVTIEAMPPCEEKNQLWGWGQRLKSVPTIVAIKLIQDRSCIQWNSLEDLFGEILLNSIANFK